MFDAKFLAAYRFFREMGESAQRAAVMASRELRLKAAIASGEIRVRWEDDLDSEDPWIDDELTRRRIEDGRYTMRGVIIERLKKCSHCQHEEWEQMDSLWGIVLDEKDDNKYQRYVETEIFCG